MHRLSSTVERKFINSIPLHDLEIGTDTGWQPVSSIHKTVPYKVHKIVLKNDLVLEGADTHIVFDENLNEVFLRDLVPNESLVMTKFGPILVASLEVFETEVNMYDITVDSDDHRFYSNDILSHNSSTILDSITFALYGKPYRSINKPNVVNSVNGSDCLVTLDFSIGKNEYQIIRGLKHSKFEIYENGKLVNQDAATRDYQKHLEENILGGLNEKCFRQIVVIGSANYVPFMQLSSSSRREVIEELLDIKIFSRMQDVNKQKSLEIRDTIKQIEMDILTVEKQIKFQKEAIERRKEESENRIKQEKDRIIQLEEQIESKKEENSILEEKVAKVAEKLGEYSTKVISGEISDIQKSITEIKTNIKRHNQFLDFLETKTCCSTCQQNISDSYKKDMQDRENAEIEKYNALLSEFNDKLKNRQELFNKINKIESAKNDILRIIGLNDGFIKITMDNIKTIETTIKTIISDEKNNNIEKDVLLKLKDQYLGMKTNRNELTDQKVYHDVISGMLKDGGIKTKIISQYIPIMNKIINEYLEKFGLPIEFTFDDQFNEIIKSRYRDNFQYNNFSEGEKQRINTALLLAWRQLARSKNTTNTNLLILDEVFDSSLDAGATEELLNILLSMDKDTNIFIISHKADLTDKVRSHIEFEKRGNFTHMKTGNQ